MIKLKTLLEYQSREIPKKVYHFTPPDHFVEIWNSNKLKKNRETGMVSFTSDPELWIFRGLYSWETMEIGVRLTFNSNSLPKLIPYEYSTGIPGGESFEDEEEFVIKGDLTGVRSKVKEIVAGSWTKDYLKKNLPKNVFGKIKWV